MKIEKLKYQDTALQWSLNETFFNKLTLLVGASGVGKTQILNSILRLKEIADGKSISGINWEITFTTLNKDEYIWSGEFENKGDVDFSNDDDNEFTRNKPLMIFEKIQRNGTIIVDRENDKLLFKGEQTVRLPQQQSTLYLLKEEELIKPAYEGFRKIIFSDQSDSQREPYRIRFVETKKLEKSLSSIEKIRESKEDIRIKLFLTYKNVPEVFEKIKNRYFNIFPQIEDIKVEPIENENDGFPFFFREYPFIQVKEKEVTTWIKQQNISSGMFRSLIHISEIYLCSEGSVFLIDEFENSLGINCINEITSDILSSQRQLQFILTSHHPYIINNIHFDNWKLVTRNKGVVKTHNAKDFNLGDSKHDTFMQLIQLDQYQTGKE